MLTLMLATWLGSTAIASDPLVTIFALQAHEDEIADLKFQQLVQRALSHALHEDVRVHEAITHQELVPAIDPTQVAPPPNLDPTGLMESRHDVLAIVTGAVESTVDGRRVTSTVHVRLLGPVEVDFTVEGGDWTEKRSVIEAVLLTELAAWAQREAHADDLVSALAGLAHSRRMLVSDVDLRERILTALVAHTPTAAFVANDTWADAPFEDF